MIEKRKLPRIRLAAKGMLSHDDTNYQGQLENISLKGALIRFEQGIVVPQGGENILAVYIEGEEIPLQIVVEVVCTTHALTGVKFVSCAAGTETRLSQLVEKLASEQDQLKSEQDKFRKHLSDYLR